VPYDGDINEGIASPVVGRILEEISNTQNVYRRVAAEKMNTEIQIYADQYNLGKKLDDAAFEPGDLVWMKDHSPTQKGQVKKFTRFKWIGPLVVTSRPYPGVYMLKWRDSGKKWQSPMAQIQLKEYIENEEELSSTSGAADTPATPALETPICSRHAAAPVLTPEVIATPAPLEPAPLSNGQPGILKRNTEASNDTPQPRKVTEILKKRIHRSGERQYLIQIQDGDRKWISEDDTPLSLIPIFEAKWQHNKNLKDIRDAPPIPSKGTRRSSRRRRQHLYGHP
jgi:hypothetical protein